MAHLLTHGRPREHGAISIWRHRPTSIGIQIIEIRRSHRLIFNMRIPYLEKPSFYWNEAKGYIIKCENGLVLVYQILFCWHAWASLINTEYLDMIINPFPAMAPQLNHLSHQGIHVQLHPLVCGCNYKPMPCTQWWVSQWLSEWRSITLNMPQGYLITLRR